MALGVFYFLLVFSVSCASADEIDMEVTSGNVIKFLRAMTNQTQGADSLNLPANASSIRENITDTFSCENRTYGYYADVDNDCQIFHVCLPSQTPSGRNVTYRWSFICPNQTVFSQEVLVCTWPRDALPCEESPMYYDLNMDIGKVPEDAEEGNNPTNTAGGNRIKLKKNQKNPKRRPVIRKQNLEVQNLLQEVVDEEMMKMDEQLDASGIDDVPDEIVPVVVDVENVPYAETGEVEIPETGGRIIEERSLWRGRKIRRGGFRFKADV